MNKDILKQVIIDQREYFLNGSLVKRDFSPEENVNYCFVGIRRTGKSYMLYQQIGNLLDAGVSLSEILYISFEDERLLEIDTKDLDVILEIGHEMAGNGKKPYVFLDEVQIVPGWEKFVRRLADMKYRVSITGSNSKMLSREIASTLGGRFLPTQVFPYSLAEYLRASGKEKNYRWELSTRDKADVCEAYGQYVRCGAFPELVNIKIKKAYLSGIYQSIYIGDVLARNGISNELAVRLILKKIAETVMKPVSFSRLANILNSIGAGIGKQTVINYVGYMKEAYLLFTVQNYAAKLVDRESAPKYYFMDTGLLGLLVMNCETAQLENLVAIELVRRYGTENVFFYESNVEIDFYVPEEKLAIQVSYSVLDDIGTRERELNALTKLRNFLPDTKCLIVTNSEESRLEYNGIVVDVVPAWKWLLER